MTDTSLMTYTQSWSLLLLRDARLCVSVYFPLAKFQLVSCNLSLAMFWQITKSHKLPKLCSTTLNMFKNCLVEHGLNFLSSIKAANF